MKQLRPVRSDDVVAFVQTRDHVVHPQQVGRERATCGADGCSRLTTACGQPRLDISEPLSVEQLLQHRTTLIRARSQKGRKVSLGQKHDLDELLQAHAEDLLEHHGDLVVARPEIHPARAHQLLEDHPRRNGGLPDATLLRSREVRRPADPQTAPAGREVQGHLGDGPLGSMVASQAGPRAGSGAGNGGIQGETDGVQDACLASAGGAVDQEQTRRR
jgi:hypothetical protein